MWGGRRVCFICYQPSLSIDYWLLTVQFWIDVQARTWGKDTGTDPDLGSQINTGVRSEMVSDTEELHDFLNNSIPHMMIHMILSHIVVPRWWIWNHLSSKVMRSWVASKGNLTEVVEQTNLLCERGVVALLLSAECCHTVESAFCWYGQFWHYSPQSTLSTFRTWWWIILLLSPATTEC